MYVGIRLLKYKYNIFCIPRCIGCYLKKVKILIIHCVQKVVYKWKKKCILYFTKIIRYSSASALLEKYLIKHGIYKIKKNSIQILLLLWFIY